jgi:hypothetical protein
VQAGFDITDTPYRWILFRSRQLSDLNENREAWVMVSNLIQPARSWACSQNEQTRLVLRRFATSRKGRFFGLKANRSRAFLVQKKQNTFGFAPIALRK